MVVAPGRLTSELTGAGYWEASDGSGFAAVNEEGGHLITEQAHTTCDVPNRRPAPLVQGCPYSPGTDSLPNSSSKQWKDAVCDTAWVKGLGTGARRTSQTLSPKNNHKTNDNTADNGIACRSFKKKITRLHCI